MTRVGGPRQPGDPAPGDRDFGPLGGFFDDIHHSVRAGERARETRAGRVAGGAPGSRSALRRLFDAWRRRFGRPR